MRKPAAGRHDGKGPSEGSHPVYLAAPQRVFLPRPRPRMLQAGAAPSGRSPTSQELAMNCHGWALAFAASLIAADCLARPPQDKPGRPGAVAQAIKALDSPVYEGQRH